MKTSLPIYEDAIQARITEMASDIDFYYYQQDWYRHSQEPVVVIGVLTGAMFFMADLVRKLSIRTELDFIRVSTYPGKSIIAQEPKITLWPKRNLHDTAHVLLVDDILDTGKTLGLIEDDMLYECPRSMKTAVLLRKPGKAKNIETVDFVGFDIPDKFVIGYGLDYNGKYRELPYVAVWSEDEFGTSKEKMVNFRKSIPTGLGQSQYPQFFELCRVIEFLLDEIERIKLPPMITLKQLPDPDPMKQIGPLPCPQTPHDPLKLPPEITKLKPKPFRIINPSPRRFGSKTDDPNPRPFETTDNPYPMNT